MLQHKTYFPNHAISPPKLNLPRNLPQSKKMMNKLRWSWSWWCWWSHLTHKYVITQNLILSLFSLLSSFSSILFLFFLSYQQRDKYIYIWYNSEEKKILKYIFGILESNWHIINVTKMFFRLQINEDQPYWVRI